MPETEWTVVATGIREWERIRDVIAPALRRDLPGVLIDVDERPIRSTIPDPIWQGASLTVIGLESRTAFALSEALRSELDHNTGGQFSLLVYDREVIGDEGHRLMQHRESPRMWKA